MQRRSNVSGVVNMQAISPFAFRLSLFAFRLSLLPQLKVLPQVYLAHMRVVGELP